MNKELAKITKASLEIQERDILTFWIHVNYEEGMSQGVGGIFLDRYNKEKKSRKGTAYGCEVIRRLFIELQVNDFAEMPGKHIWVLGTGVGLGFTPTGVQSLKSNNPKSKPVIFADILDEFKDE